MKNQQRFTVRKSPANPSYFCIWDRVLNCVAAQCRTTSHKPLAYEWCKYMNKRGEVA